MHEYSVVASLIELCEENARKHNSKEVSKIIISIGERAGMDKSLFLSAFEGFREESDICKNAELEIKDEKIALKCKACAHEFEPENLNYGICPKCQNTNLDIIRGNEMLLLSLELKEG